MDTDKLFRAAQLEAEAARLRKEAFDNRRLPKKWKVGQKVRMITHSEFGWRVGDIMTIHRLETPGLPAEQYQVFFTIHGTPKNGIFWTTPADVELVEDV